MVFACVSVGTALTTALADTVSATITIGSFSIDVEIDPTGTFAYATNSGGANSVSKINLATDTVVATISVGSGPHGMAINPAGTYAYVANTLANTVSKINLATDTVVATISVESGPTDVAINPAGTYAYVTHNDSNNVLKINLTTDTIVSTIGVGSDINGIDATYLTINPAGTFAYVNGYSGSGYSGSYGIRKIDLASDTVVSIITVGSYPRKFAINPAGTFAYVISSGSVYKVNLATDTIVSTITMESSLRDITINPAGTFAYVTNSISGKVSKINLILDTVVSAISVGIGAPYNPAWHVAINPAGTYAYVTSNYFPTVYKIALTATEPQSITFTSVGTAVAPVAFTQLLGKKSVTVTASATSGFPVSFSSSTPTVCTVSGSTVAMITIGDCTINADQAGGSLWDAAPQVSTTFTILPSPPVGEVGISIKNGDSSTNTKSVILNPIWPEYATSVRISNDGGFAFSKTVTKELVASIDWELDDSVKGIFTKVVYIRFNGVSNTTQTYSDDIILDTNPPVIESSTAATVSGSIDLTLKATDDITGVDKVEIKNGAATVTKDYETKVSVPLADLLLSVSSMGVQSLASTSVQIRVSDKAGNWSAYKALSVSGVVAAPTAATPTATTRTATAPTVTKSKSATAKSIAIFAKIPLLSTSKVSLKVVSGYAKFCKVSGTSLKGIKAGTCKVTVTVTPKKGKAIPKTVTLKVTN